MNLHSERIENDHCEVETLIFILLVIVMILLKHHKVKIS